MLSFPKSNRTWTKIDERRIKLTRLEFVREIQKFSARFELLSLSNQVLLSLFHLIIKIALYSNVLSTLYFHFIFHSHHTAIEGDGFCSSAAKVKIFKCSFIIRFNSPFKRDLVAILFNLFSFMITNRGGGCFGQFCLIWIRINEQGKKMEKISKKRKYLHPVCDSHKKLKWNDCLWNVFEMAVNSLNQIPWLHERRERENIMVFYVMFLVVYKLLIWFHKLSLIFFWNIVPSQLSSPDQ